MLQVGTFGRFALRSFKSNCKEVSRDQVVLDSSFCKQYIKQNILCQSGLGIVGGHKGGSGNNYGAEPEKGTFIMSIYQDIFLTDILVLDQDTHRKLMRQVRVPEPGSTLLLAAREVVAPNDYVFVIQDYNLHLFADSIRMDHGQIEVKGGPNNPSPQVVVGCEALYSVNISASGVDGTKGGRGLAGAQGRPGKNGKVRPPRFVLRDDDLGGGTPGGNGGTGGRGRQGHPGGPGLRGGDIVLRFIEDRSGGTFNPSTSLQVPGGRGGAGGDGGPGGPGGSGGAGDPAGEPGEQGESGEPGPAGPDGPFGTVSVTKVSRDEYGSFARDLVGTWLQHRLRRAEYHYRFYRSRAPYDRFLGKALDDVNGILLIDPHHERATIIRDGILNNQNILGLARFEDVLADFDYYESFIVNYQNVIQDVFSQANQLLQDAVDINFIKQDLERQISHLANQVQMLKADDVDTAMREKVLVEGELNTLTQMKPILKDQLGRMQFMLMEKQFSIENTLYTHWDLAQALIGIAQGGPAVFVALKALPDLFAVITHESAEQIDEALQRSDSLETERFKQASGGLDVLMRETNQNKILNWTKIYQQMKGTYKDDDSKEMREIRTKEEEIFEVSRGILLSEMRLAQLKRTVQTIEWRIGYLTGEADRLKKDLEQDVSPELEARLQMALSLIRTGQAYMENLVKFNFLAARAVEMYLVEDVSAEIRYDYGYIPFEQEESYLADRSLSSLRSLRDAYITSWMQWPGISQLAFRYKSYFINNPERVEDIYYRSFNDSEYLDRFKKEASLFFSVDLDDLPNNRFEAKVEAVGVNLPGATATQPSITIQVEHCGPFMTKKRGGEIKTTEARSRIANVFFSPTGPADSTSAETNPRSLAFWGRGIATNWRVIIEPDILEKQGVNLAGLTEIQVWIKYSCFPR